MGVGTTVTGDLKIEESDAMGRSQIVRRMSIFCQQVSESHRTIEIGHRSARSFCRLRRSSTIVIIGLRGGGPRSTEIGGVIQPWRMAPSNNASDRIGLRAGSGGPISATTRRSTPFPPIQRNSISVLNAVISGTELPFQRRFLRETLAQPPREHAAILTALPQKHWGRSHLRRALRLVRTSHACEASSV